MTTTEENGPWYTITPYVAQNIRALVRREDLTLKMLAEFCGIPRSTLGNIVQTPPGKMKSTAYHADNRRSAARPPEWLQEEHDD